ncbi:class I fructose-bisphosphate aldolase [bacterium]|nr:class I fructose-bisphosphate aldolase [bacterium]
MSRFIAAMDHSGGSTGGVLERYGREYTEDNKMDRVHEMRMRMVNSPDFNDKNIWAAILYQDTVTRGMVNILDEKGIDTFLKIDSGCDESGLLKQFPIQKMLEFATNGIGPRIYGTKMRSIVKADMMAHPVLKQQFQLARTIYDYKLIPIIEPEVPIDHPDKAAIEDALMYHLQEFLDEYPGKCILKLTPPETPNLYHNLTVFPNVEQVVFLSGGYSTAEACNRLGLNDNVSASFSRALSENLKHDLTDTEFNAIISSNIKLITEAS